MFFEWFYENTTLKFCSGFLGVLSWTLLCISHCTGVEPFPWCLSQYFFTYQKRKSVSEDNYEFTIGIIRPWKWMSTNLTFEWGQKHHSHFYHLYLSCSSPGMYSVTWSPRTGSLYIIIVIKINFEIFLRLTL